MPGLRKPELQASAQSVPVTEFSVTTRHGRVAGVETAGDGAPLIFIHGNSGSRDVFQRQLTGGLAASHHLVALDLPGHGLSADAPDPTGSYTLPGYADAIVEVLEARGIDEAAFVGWSLGGHVALEILSVYPETLGVFLIGTPPLSHTPSALGEAFLPTEAAALLGKAALSEAEIHGLATAAVGPALAPLAAGAIRRTDGRARQRLLESLFAQEFTDERDLVETLDLPVAVVLGQNDPFVRREYVESLLYRNLWGGMCHVIPSAGHAPFLDSPVFDLLLSAFASDMERRRTELRENPTLCYGG